MIAPKQTYKSVLQKIARPARKILHAHRIKGLHELRAAYECERYEHVTRNMAPVNGGALYRYDRYSDAKARIQISHELGQGRIDIISAYIGGSG